MNPQCCKDHECDYCAKCLSGRCCRTDNPHYTLPSLGEWDGMLHGKLGVLSQIDGKAECHCCGETFGHLGAHISRKHDLTPDEYKSIFGLRASTGLIGDDLANKRRENTAHLAEYQEIGAAHLASFTPEQRLFNKRQKGTSLEEKLNPDYIERRKKALHQGLITRQRRSEENAVYLNCPVCKKEFRERSSQKTSERKYCSQECYLICPVRVKRGAKMCRAQVKKTKGKPPKYAIRCKQCEKLFRSRRKNSIFCSKECHQKNADTHEHLRELNRQRVE